MKIEVVESTDEEREHTGEDLTLSLRVSMEEAQILRAMLGRFRKDINLMRSWDEELEYAGVERVALQVVAATDCPVLSFQVPEE